MQIAGYITGILINVSMGLIGGGGIILTVPVLVYLFRLDALIATTYSLLIVGLSGVVGAVSYFRKGLVNLMMAIVFGLPSIVALLVTRAFVAPAIPEGLFQVDGFVLRRSAGMLQLFAILMILAAYNMIRKGEKPEDQATTQGFDYPLMWIRGALVGFLMGLVGVGGGFLIIPSLVLVGKLEMKTAIGTSLTIITANALIGFIGTSSRIDVDWTLLVSVTALCVTGIFIGIALSKKIDGAKLKPAFGWFIAVMGIYILIREAMFTR